MSEMKITALRVLGPEEVEALRSAIGLLSESEGLPAADSVCVIVSEVEPGREPD